MKNDYLYIPNKVRVGFKNDGDGTKIAYFIYQDENGKLRKENSWNSWRDKNIEPIDIDNTPLEGYRIRKVRNGYRYSLWEQRDAKIIIEHPTLNCVFEITPANLLELITAEGGAGVDNRGVILSPCVMCWCGTALLLMSAKCSEYESSLKHSKEINLNKKIKPEIGHTYRNRDGYEYTFLGRGVIYDKNTIKDEDEAKKKGVEDTIVTFVNHGHWGCTNTRCWYQIKKHNVFFFKTSYENVSYHKTCPNFVYETDKEILSPEKCQALIDKWPSLYSWNDEKVNPVMDWKFDYIELTLEEVKDIIKSTSYEDRRALGFTDYGYNTHNKYAEFRFIVNRKNTHAYWKNPSFTYDRAWLRMYDDGRIEGLEIEGESGRKEERKFNSLEEAIEVIKPCKMVFYSYLNPNEVIKEIC